MSEIGSMLREKVAERIWQAEYRRATGRERSIEWAEVNDNEVIKYLYVADAILQIEELCSRASLDKAVEALKSIKSKQGNLAAPAMRAIARNALAALASPAEQQEKARVPKVRTSHHRNKEEAARLQAIVNERCAAPPAAVASPEHGGENVG